MKLPEFGWSIETNSFLTGDFGIIHNTDWMANKQSNVNVNQSLL